MKAPWKLLIAIVLLLHTILAGSPASAAVSDAKMTKFRVYQNDKALKEFANQTQAINYAMSYAYSHVEKIANRDWVWDNFPRYLVYQNGVSKPEWQFQSYSEALTLAKSLSNVHIRDLHQPGWVYSNHQTIYQLYQGDKTQANWSFATLEAAKLEAKRWSNAHIMNTATNEWIWDNLTAAQRKAQREGKQVYEITINDVASGEKYGYLQDAIEASAAIADSKVINTTNGRIVHSSVGSFTVLQNGRTIRAYFGIEQAIAYAKTLANAQILRDGTEWWTNIPYLQVKQGDKQILSVHTRQAAVQTAMKYANSHVVTSDGRTIWSNVKQLLILGWNGSSRSDTIVSQLSQTQGIDIDSPSWFELEAADGTLKDTSDPALARLLQTQGIELHPLVHNQFDAKLTSAFLRDSAAQDKFIASLVTRLTQLQADGINIDFEAMAGGDRNLYTAFVAKLTEAAHKAGLIVSIDLPRGSLAWNHQTAFDHEKLAGIVDYIMIMTYDQYWRGSTSPGSVAGLQWTEAGVQEFLSYGIPRSKLMLGIPFYVREWQLDKTGKLIGNRTLLMKDIPALIKAENPTAVFDAQFNQTKYTYDKDGSTYVFWAENADTVKARMDIAKKYDLAGIAIWRLGYEQADLWTTILREK